MTGLLEKRNHWKAEVLQWKKSNQSINGWCRKRKIPTSTFIYWKNIFFPKSKFFLNKKSFTEIIEDKTVSEAIEIDVKGITIRVNKNFDQETLKKCLIITRSL